MGRLQEDRELAEVVTGTDAGQLDLVPVEGVEDPNRPREDDVQRIAWRSLLEHGASGRPEEVRRGADDAHERALIERSECRHDAEGLHEAVGHGTWHG